MSSLFQNSPAAFMYNREKDHEKPQNEVTDAQEPIEPIERTKVAKRAATSEASCSSRNGPKRAKGSNKNDVPDQSATSVEITNPIVRWDCSGIKEAPKVDKIRKLHVYDFDNTIFKSPSPNPSLYNDSTVGILCNAEMLHNGGWWAFPLTLRNVGDGWDVESQRAWKSFWNEDIVELMKLSAEDDETLTIVMTGRRKNLFTNIINDILKSRSLKFHALVLKQGNFDSTFKFKTQVLTDILNHYHNIQEVTVYDDRKSELNGFQTFLNEYNEAMRPDLVYSLVPVFTPVKYLDPKTERELVEEYVDQHNKLVENGDTSVRLQQISLKKSFFYDAYVVDCHSKADVIEFLIKKYPDYFTEEYLQVSKFQNDFIAISKTKLPKVIEKRLAGDKKKFYWRITHFGFSDESCAVRAEPVDNENISTLFSPPLLPVSSKGKSATTPIDAFQQIENWIPVDDGLTITTYFGQVISFKIASETAEARKKKRRLDGNLTLRSS